MRRLYVDCPFDVKQFDAETGRIEGYGAVFGNVDMGLDRIEPGAFTDAIKGLDRLPMLWQHDQGEPIGVWDDFAEDKKGLFVSGQLNLSRDSGAADVPKAWQARALAQQKALTGLSIGYSPVDFKFEDEVRVLEKVRLFEISVATLPMNPEARVSGVKSLTNKQFSQLLRENLGLSREAAEALRAGGFKHMREHMGVLKEEPGDGLKEAESIAQHALDRLRRAIGHE